jgi:hypothetical protein
MVSTYLLNEDNTASVYSKRVYDEGNGLFNNEPTYQLSNYFEVTNEGNFSVELYRTEYIFAINTNNDNTNATFSLLYTGGLFLRATVGLFVVLMTLFQM